MYNVKGYSEIYFEERKSKFIGYIKEVNTVEDAQSFINSIKEKHKDATHNVYVYRIMKNNVESLKYDDDNEPQNTAAKPMADIFIRNETYNFAMVATRYFGGIKLGAGGLIRAYARVAKELYNEANIEEYVEKNQYIIIFNYDKLKIIERLINELNIEVLEKSYLDKINLKLNLSSEEFKEFSNIFDIEIIKV